MTPERWQAVKRLFEDALQREPAQRAGYLADVAKTDPTLADEVRALLSAQGRAEEVFGGVTRTAGLKTLGPGTRLGPYEIVSLLGAGGMGEVYRARDTRLDRTVAIKVLPTDVAADAEARRRFEREARTISKLNHPHICSLHDVGEQDGLSFLVMEYLEGESLADRLSRGPLPLDEALRYARQIAEALEEAHQHGIVHRDLKPGNVMLTKKGAKLLDFGIAKLRAAVVSEEVPTATASVLTGEGLIVGTPQYMAPEQLEGRPVDARTDIFAFGLVLYEMITGRKAFEASTRAGLIAAILERDPQPLSPPSSDALVKRCLAKRPADRWQSCADLLEHLEGGPGGMAVGIRSLGRRDLGRRTQRAAAITGAVVLAAGAWWLIQTWREHVRTGARQAASIAVLPFTNVGGATEEEYFSDGLTEELIGALARVEGLRVAARTSSFAFQGKNVPVDEIARRLGVANLIEGSVRRSGGRVRINAQLVNARDGLTLWSQSYDRDLTDIFAVQQDIARSVAGMLQLRLPVGSAAGRRPLADFAPYDLYLRGRAAWARRSPGGFTQAISLFQQAIDRDPQFALAYAGLADAYFGQASYVYVPMSEGLPRARTAAERALALDGTLADAYASLARIQNNGLEWDEAERSLRKAIELNRSLATAHHQYALLLAQRGRLDEARKEIAEAAELDPLAPVVIAASGMVDYLRRDYEEARAKARRAHDLAPENFGILCTLAKIEAARDSADEALRAGRRAVALAPTNAIARAHLARAYARFGDPAQARELLARLEAEPEPCVGCIVDVHLALDQRQEALMWVERGGWTPTGNFYFPKVDPAYDRFRRDSRFVFLLQKLGLVDPGTRPL
jgi:serine/threonine-protein kinase